MRIFIIVRVVLSRRIKVLKGIRFGVDERFGGSFSWRFKLCYGNLFLVNVY